MYQNATLLQPAPAIADQEFRSLQKRSLSDARSLHRHVEAKASAYSLRQLINSACGWKMFPEDRAAVSAVRELSDACKDQTGHTPWGTWVPLAALARRDLTTSGTAALVTDTLSPTLQSALSPHSAVMAGATILSGLNGSGFSLPAIDTPVNASNAWVDEGTPGPTLEPSTRLARLAPKTLVFTLYVSRRLMMQTSVDLEAALRAELLKNTLQAIDAAALIGTTPDAPIGLLGDPDLQLISAGANGSAPTWAQLAELEFQVGNRAGTMVAPAFLTSPKMRKKYRTTQRAAGLDFILGDQANSLLGHPLRISSMVPDDLDKGTSTGVCSALVYGDWNEVVVGFWGPQAVDILVDGVTQARDGLIKITVRAEVGVAVRDIRAFAAYKDLLAD
jgi:HK97 family phage major capsid protein